MADTYPVQAICRTLDCARSSHYCPALLKNHHIALSMADMGQAWQNRYAERLMRTIKEQEVALSDNRDIHDAYNQIGFFLEDVFNRERIHSGLGYLTPFEFGQQHISNLIDTQCAS